MSRFSPPEQVFQSNRILSYFLVRMMRRHVTDTHGRDCTFQELLYLPGWYYFHRIVLSVLYLNVESKPKKGNQEMHVFKYHAARAST